MPIIDKRNLIPEINRGGGRGLILGAGRTREIAGDITTDLIDYPEVDIVGDLYEVLGQIGEARLERLYAAHLIEHIEQPQRLLAEVARVLNDGGRATFIAPHFSNPFFYSDPTHRAFFGLYSFCYLAVDKVGFRRTVPDYVRNPELHLVEVRLVFRSYRPNYLRHGMFKVWERVFNATRWMQELYEEIFSHGIGCYEVRYVVEARKGDAGASPHPPPGM